MLQLVPSPHRRSHSVRSSAGSRKNATRGATTRVSALGEGVARLQRTAGNRAVTSLIGAAPTSAGPVPVVQRYETGEHALIGGGRDYPMVNAGEIALPNGARATPADLVAFGDFYADLDQMARMPRQETEALIGFTRLEALWYQARRRSAAAPPGKHDLRVFPEIDGSDKVWATKV